MISRNVPRAKGLHPASTVNAGFWVRIESLYSHSEILTPQKIYFKYFLWLSSWNLLLESIAKWHPGSDIDIRYMPQLFNPSGIPIAML